MPFKFSGPDGEPKRASRNSTANALEGRAFSRKGPAFNHFQCLGHRTCRRNDVFECKYVRILPARSPVLLIVSDLHEIRPGSPVTRFYCDRWINPFLNRSLFAGLRDVAPTAPAIVLFGAGFGAAAASQGIAAFTAVGMSGLVFAGSAQMAAVELWGDRDAWLPILLAVFAINFRHLAFGASLGGRLSGLPGTMKLPVLALLSDINWAATVTSKLKGREALLHLLGGGILLWTAWVLGTVLGVASGMSERTNERFGIDAIMPCFFVCLLVSQLRPSKSESPNGEPGE